jgi:polyphenol oxidase
LVIGIVIVITGNSGKTVILQNTSIRLTMDFDFQLLKPDWDVPTVKAFTVLARSINNERVTFDNDGAGAKKFRKILEHYIRPQHPVTWIKQIHGDNIVRLPIREDVEADGSFTALKGVVCEVITADCLPIVFTDRSGTTAGIVHAGRRGLYKNIISRLVNALQAPADDILVWIGPGISGESYLISKEIKDEFVGSYPSCETAFLPGEKGSYHMDLYRIAKIQLKETGIPEGNISGAGWDTYRDNLFHSARREGIHSGRMVTVVWIE